MQTIIHIGYLLLIFILNNSIVLSQEKGIEISGNIFDETSGKPLASVSVFISGTTWGTSTDEEGFYKIPLINPGKYELVVSILGYEVLTKIINISENSANVFNLKLKPRTYELNSIDVISDKPVEWQENLRIFKNLFLGQNDYSSDCIIENEVRLEFDKRENNILSAGINEPLIIYNHFLGYKISCILLNFVWNMDERRIRFQVKPRFEEMPFESDDENKIWLSNREEIFKGSLTHFLQSLINKDFMNQGFKIYLSQLPIDTKNTASLEQIFSYDKLLKPGLKPDEYILRFGNYLRVALNDEISWLKLCYDEVTIDKHGNAEEPIPFETYGYWAKSGLADMLPSNFESDKH
jgi:hypothetical protein